eukprot:1159999-Pelagomonas_calceolata.AAC.1
MNPRFNTHIQHKFLSTGFSKLNRSFISTPKNQGRKAVQPQKAGHICNSRKQGKSATAESRAKVQQQKAGQKCNCKKQGTYATAEAGHTDKA